jgi:hypothetical protein
MRVAEGDRPLRPVQAAQARKARETAKVAAIGTGYPGSALWLSLLTVGAIPVEPRY